MLFAKKDIYVMEKCWKNVFITKCLYITLQTQQNILSASMC